MPKACSVGNDETGNCTGIALALVVPASNALGDVLESGVGAVDAEAPVGAAADNVLAVVVDVARGGGTY